MDFKKIIFKKELVILFLLVIVGSFLRLQGVLTNSFAFTYDVGRDMLALQNIVVNHDLMFIGATTGIPGVFYGPWWYYMLVPFFIIFRGDPAGIALIMAIVGVASIIVSYILGKKIDGIFLGLGLAAFVSVSPVLVSLSVQIWNPNIAPLFVMLTLYCLYKIYKFEKKDLRYFFFLGILLALNIDIEILWGILFTIGTILSLFFLLYKKIKIKQIFSFALGMILIASPRIFFEIKHGFQMSKSLITFITSKNTIEDPITFTQLVENRVNSFVDMYASSLTFNNQILAWVFIVFTVISAILFYKRSSEIFKKFMITLFTILIVFFIGTISFGRALWPHYLVGLPVIYILLFTLALFMIPKQEKYQYLIILAVSLLFIINFDPIRQLKSFMSPQFIGNASVYRNQLAVVDYVYKEANGKDFKFVAYTPPVFDYTYGYLFMWYGEKKYKYLPTEETKDATYSFFIIEPDPGYEDRPKWWLRDREKNGKIIKSYTLPSGVVIQTRIEQ